MKIGILGGSFNPIHNGHLQIAQNLLDLKIVDQIWLLPCYSHVWNKDLAPAKHRVKMIELTLKEKNFSGAANVFSARSGSRQRQGCEHCKKLFANRKIFLSKLEILQSKPMYTINTVKILLKKYPQHNFLWIIGSDNFKTLNKWKSYEELLDLIPFIIIPRINHFSSTEVRSRLQNGLSIQDLVPKSVEKYIIENHLYEK